MTTILCPKRKVLRFHATNVPFWSNVLTWLPVSDICVFTYRSTVCEIYTKRICQKNSRNPDEPKPQLRAQPGKAWRFASVQKYCDRNLLKKFDIFILYVLIFSPDPAVPDTLTHLIRSCSGKSTVDSCPEEYKNQNQTIAELCSSYTAMVFEPNAAYR